MPVHEQPGYPIQIPPLVARAYATAEAIGFGADGGVSSCLPGIGAFLAAIAAARPGGRIAEIGTGVGAGSAWLLAGMDESATLTTIELDEARALVARDVLAEDPRATVVIGRWQDHLPRLAPFDMLFVDGGYESDVAEEPGTTDALVEFVSIGGQLILDDLTAQAEWSAAMRGTVDQKRELALRSTRLVGAEFYVPDGNGAVGGIRTGGLIMTRIA